MRDVRQALPHDGVVGVPVQRNALQDAKRAHDDSKVRGDHEDDVLGDGGHVINHLGGTER